MAVVTHVCFPNPEFTVVFRRTGAGSYRAVETLPNEPGRGIRFIVTREDGMWYTRAEPVRFDMHGQAHLDGQPFPLFPAETLREAREEIRLHCALR